MRTGERIRRAASGGRTSPPPAVQAARDERDAALLLGRSAAAPRTVRPADVLRLQRVVGNRAVGALLGAPPAVRRTIKWDAEATQTYRRSAAKLVEELKSEFGHVETGTIAKLVEEVEQKKASWTPYQAYLAIKNHLRQTYPLPPSAVALDGTNISSDEAKWYFLSNFKTFMEAVIDGKYGFKFVNTPDDNHAEDNMMQRLDEFIVEKGWHEDFSESHTLVITINNSPCTRCARRLYDWRSRDIFDEFEVRFANMYEKGDNFTQAAAKLRSGGIVMSLFSVTENLLPLIKVEGVKKSELESRKKKDQTEAMDWKKE